MAEKRTYPTHKNIRRTYLSDENTLSEIRYWACYCGT